MKLERWVNRNPYVAFPLMLVMLLVFSAVVSTFLAWQEAAAYNRATGKHVSTWDAIWLDLRVQSEAKP